MKRYADMNEQELLAEIGALTEKARKAEQLGMPNEYAVHERKIAMAKSYLVDVSQFEVGATYTIEEDGEQVPFKIDYFKGIFAWGYRGEDISLQAVPVSVLKK
ncbi:YfhH family protein [Aureibacillus halotolerans]|uniref:Uncharacterized protein DUF1811 n=1 Tax=Aureibacillus halotolerans TaxID=1508390 RepID=A0A4R6TT36_9BACI|nr:YfhH family protein [Aureibacillus halotolerans]TDQ33751.1 uncharacterized protein DUF1811 [Aureibacillus halotolerans]